MIFGMYFYQLGTHFPQLEQQMKQGFENQVHMIIALNHKSTAILRPINSLADFEGDICTMSVAAFIMNS